MPTYWQLVGCEGIIQQCLLAIDNMEQLRTKLRQPQLSFSLEPPVFQQNNNTDIRTTLLIKNDGVVSANNLLINICVTSSVNNSTVIFKKETHLDRISQKSTSKNIDIIIPLRSFQSIFPEDTQLTIRASYAEGKTDPAKFTIDIDKGSHFTREMIPWSFAGKVQQEAFKGREEIIKELEDALNDKTRRAFSYMLYGVTRSGKTSILNFLRQRIHGKKLRGDNTQRCFLCIQWEFSSASNCSTPNALWTEFLHSSIQRAIEDWNVSEELRSAVHHILPDPQNVQGEHFRPLMEALKKLNVYPVILIDEFTFYRNLHDNGFLGPSFLSLIREFALNDYATFIMAGTYDLLNIIKDEHYGITGQFVNLVKKQVTNIKKQPAKELVNIFDKHLKFTDESCNYILHLADCRPYLIQMICYYCAQYALHLRRSILGMPEVEHVVAILCGDSDEEQDIHTLESSRFDNNLIFAKEKQYPLFAAVTTIISHSGNQKNGFISYNRLRTIWRDNALNASDLASVLDDLVERQVIENIEDEGDMGYRLRVELFRRWWHNFHPHLEKEIDAAQAYSSI